MLATRRLASLLAALSHIAVASGVTVALLAAGATAAHAQAPEETPGEGAPAGTEPASGEAATADPAVVAATPVDPSAPRLGAGLRLRYVFVPAAFVELFVDHATSMSSVGFAAEFVRRKGNFDIVVGLEYEGIDPAPGFYVEKGGDPGTNDDNDFVRGDGLALLGLDANFVWHTRLASKLDLRYGAGFGLAVVLGELKQFPANCMPGTTLADLDDPNTPKCNPGTVGTPYEEVPPVIPLVNLMIGLRYHVNDQIAMRFETGFRDTFFLGIAGDYMF